MDRFEVITGLDAVLLERVVRRLCELEPATVAVLVRQLREGDCRRGQRTST